MMSEYCILFLFLACFPKETKLTQLFCLAVCLLVCQPLFNNSEPVSWFLEQRSQRYASAEDPALLQPRKGWGPNTGSREQQVTPRPFGVAVATAPWFICQGLASHHTALSGGKKSLSRAMLWWREKCWRIGKDGGLLYSTAKIWRQANIVNAVVHGTDAFMTKKDAYKKSFLLWSLPFHVYAHHRLMVHVYSFFTWLA